MTADSAIGVDDALLKAWPLPQPDQKGDKESRGAVLVVAGSREIPGAALLAATASLRAGAGKLVIASPACVAPLLSAQMPEARVIALPEADDGGLAAQGLDLLRPLAERTAALLVGPGMAQCDSTVPFILRLLPLFGASTVVLDALAMDCAHTLPHFEQPVILTPHAGEMAHLTGLDKDDVQERALEVTVQQARTWGAVVALKGAATHVGHPDGRTWRHASRTPGLGTSGSGDVLAGVIAGLAARGATPEQAAVWGVALHARAGDRLAALTGSLGYLARELPAQVPAVMHALSGEPA
ncbi:MAG: NAD(P)H-hydrate dehydratase [Ramlibacter sp.]|jgi:ADP-dependent NAD(P)H-hydrate dehydratase|uniref:NAD(P)H-hydrate dehydratase n=1 Tax=Ramlibacter sp. TaxID=1917967 RepID=UPI0026290A73|nr:NAD(P)H-hydrate dehydratase [Ramlibacter sp.]MDB5750915.1 NAD(P)H-hydrate dehydratase [Ramlibacter sp.]